jgi:hypothetical protein
VKNKLLLLLFLNLVCSISLLAQDKKNIILFLDMNNSKSEVEAARKAAIKRGEELVVLPRNDNEKPFNKVLLKKFFAEINSQNRIISSVVFSGHHTANSGYYGTGSNNFGVIHPDDFRNELNHYPKLKNGIRSIFGAGCHSMTQTQVQNWVNYFPELEACYGYMDYGPLAATSSAPQNIYDFLTKEQQITQMTDLHRIFNTNSAILTYPTANHSAVWTTNGEGLYCDVKGNKVTMINCNYQEKLLQENYTLFKAAVNESIIPKDKTHELIFGELNHHPKLVAVKKQNQIIGFKPISKLDKNQTINDMLEIKQKLNTYCQDSKLKNFINHDQLIAMLNYKNIIANHALYYPEVLNALKIGGLTYPSSSSKRDEVLTYFHKTDGILEHRIKKAQAEQKELENAWGGFWKNNSSDHRKKIEDKKTLIKNYQSLKRLLNTFHHQFETGECLPMLWLNQTSAKPNQALLQELRSGKGMCEVSKKY